MKWLLVCMCLLFILCNVTLVTAETEDSDYNKSILFEAADNVSDTGSVNTNQPGRDNGSKEGNDDGTRVPKRALNFETAGFGPGGFGNLRPGDLAYNFFGGKIWEVNPYAAVKALGEVTTDFDRVVIFDIGIGVNFFLLDQDISPYVGSEFGFGYGRIRTNNALGFSLGGSLGFLLFRTTDIQMNVETKAQVLFNEIEESFPYFYTARIGVLF